MFLSLTGCGEDRTYKYLELTQENQWIFENMKSVYLWNDSLKEPSRKTFFASTNVFFSSILQKDDKFSFFTDSVHSPGYGITYSIFRDPLGIQKSKSYALVLFVQPGSVADIAGVKRGTWISRVGKNNLNSSNFGYLDGGEATELYTWNIELDEESMEYIWEAADTLYMNAAAETVPTDIYLDSIYTQRGHKIGYMVYNGFTVESKKHLNDVLLNFKSNEITDLVIDLRYNNRGCIDVANEFASMIIPEQYSKNTFCRLEYNNMNSYRDTTFLFDKNSVLSFEKLYIIAGEQTRGAAETFIYALRNTLGYSNVIVVGETTFGENVITETLESPYGFSINPVVAYISNENGTYSYSEGIEPNYHLNELADFYNIHKLGSLQEYMLYNVFYLIINGTLPQNV